MKLPSRLFFGKSGLLQLSSEHLFLDRRFPFDVDLNDRRSYRRKGCGRDDDFIPTLQREPFFESKDRK